MRADAQPPSDPWYPGKYLGKARDVLVAAAPGMQGAAAGPAESAQAFASKVGSGANNDKSNETKKYKRKDDSDWGDTPQVLLRCLFFFSARLLMFLHVSEIVHNAFVTHMLLRCLFCI